MRVLGTHLLSAFIDAQANPASAEAVRAWLAEFTESDWASPEELQRSFRSLDQSCPPVAAFNLHADQAEVRVEAMIDFEKRLVLITDVQGLPERLNLPTPSGRPS